MAPARSPVVSATAVAATAVEAEAGAKAMLLLGEDGLAWADRQAVAARRPGGVARRERVRHDGDRGWRRDPDLADRAGLGPGGLRAAGGGLRLGAAAVHSPPGAQGAQPGAHLHPRRPVAGGPGWPWPPTWGSWRLDDYLGFGWRELLVPGAASWRPQAIALGVVGAWGLLVVGLSFYGRRLIGQKAWRYLHYGAFGTFVAATAHGVMAGSDTTHPAVLALYLASARRGAGAGGGADDPGRREAGVAGRRPAGGARRASRRP